jgi:hypothetical protein
MLVNYPLGVKWDSLFSLVLLAFYEVLSKARWYVWPEWWSLLVHKCSQSQWVQGTSFTVSAPRFPGMMGSSKKKKRGLAYHLFNHTHVIIEGEDHQQLKCPAVGCIFVASRDTNLFFCGWKSSRCSRMIFGCGGRYWTWSGFIMRMIFGLVRTWSGFFYDLYMFTDHKNLVYFLDTDRIFGSDVFFSSLWSILLVIQTS